MMNQQITPVVKYLLIANIALYFLSSIHFPILGATLGEFFTLYDVRSNYFLPHQIVTHMFLHADTSHILYNMLGLFFLGPFLERFIGEKRFLILYFVCGIGAAFLQLGAFHFDYPTDLIHGSPIPPSMVGASGAVMGILMAVALLFPNTEFYLYMLFPVKIKYIAGALFLYDLWAAFNKTDSNTAHFAHLGGMLFAFILLKIWKANRQNFY